MEEPRKDIPENPIDTPAEEAAAGPVIGTWDEMWEQQWQEKQRAQEAKAAQEAMAIAAAKAAKKAAAAEKARASAELRALKKEEAAQKARAVAEAKAMERARAAEEARLAREAAEAERARRAEEARLAREAAEAERARQAEEARLAREAAEAERARLAEEARKAEEAEKAERARQAEETEKAREAAAVMPTEETAPVQEEEAAEQITEEALAFQEEQEASIAADIVSIMEETVQEKAEATKPAGRFTLPKRVYYILIGLFSAALILSVAYLGTYFWETSTADRENEDLAQLRQDAMPTEPSTQPGSTDPSGAPPIEVTPDDPYEARPPIEVELKEVYEMNSDLVGWIDFNDESNIDLPVMQSPYDEDFYLEHKFNKEPNGTVPIGALYVPLDCNVFEPSDNVIIYGHNVRSGSMFKKLENYREQSYWETHQTFRFDTLYERHTYRIFAVFKTAATQYTSTGEVYGYPYHTYTDFASEEEFNQFIADVKGEAFTTGGYKGGTYYDTGITPTYGDKLLCLSTCEYTMGEPSNPGSRLVVMAVRID